MKIILLINIIFLSFSIETAYSQFIQLDSAKNHISNIDLNQNWMKFALKMKQLKENKQGQITILHLGDSHIQGGYFTNQVRELLNTNYGISGRGWIFPYSLVNSNGAEDVVFHSTSSWNYLKYNNIKPLKKTNISGFSLETNDSLINLSFALKQNSNVLYPFNELTIFHQTGSVDAACSMDHQVVNEVISNNISSTQLNFNSLIDSVNLTIHPSQNKLEVFGFQLNENKKPGINYEVLGINGIGYATFDQLIDYMPYLIMLHPDCIIISLGTNDAFSQTMDIMQLKYHVHSMVQSIKKLLPNTCLILTTPGDHLIHKSRLNPNLVKLHSAVIEVAKQEQCAYWDFFDIMGGLGSSREWNQNGLFYKDMLHLSKVGYKYQGELFYKAIRKSLDQSTYDQ